MSAETTQTLPPPPPPLKANKEYALKTGTPDTGLLLADIRNGVTLKPTKTKDKSTATFIKNSNTPLNNEALQSNGYKDEVSIDGVKDALQEELRNTLKRKVKKQDVERGDPTKNHEIEKQMEIKRTDVELKVNNTCSDAGKSATLFPPPKPARSFNGKSETAEIVKSPVLNKFPAKTETPKIANNTALIKVEPKVNIEPFGNSSSSLKGTLKKVTPQKELKIDVSVAQADSLKNSILSPEVKSGNAAIRPSQIKTLTKQGSHVSHTDIVDDTKAVKKSPVTLVEAPISVINNSASTPIQSETYRSGPSATPTPSRTTILDTKKSNSFKKLTTSPKATPNDPSKKLLISHPKASFTLPRSKSRKTNQTEPTGSKPVFRILTELEQAEQRQEKAKPRADSPGAEPVLNSYVSFAKELANAPNNYPDTVTKKTTVGTLQEDLFYGKTNLRDIKIDIVENGQCKVVSK
uniref:WH2 domain-containing protein n=1 Tax=Culex tarsalis TaxID=7177 RepID=A0A1Q3FKJ0_CULTA